MCHGGAWYECEASFNFSWEVPLKHAIPVKTSLSLLCITSVVLALAALSVSKSGPATK